LFKLTTVSEIGSVSNIRNLVMEIKLVSEKSADLNHLTHLPAEKISANSIAAKSSKHISVIHRYREHKFSHIRQLLLHALIGV
jgi:hypothetical protein